MTLDFNDGEGVKEQMIRAGITVQLFSKKNSKIIR